MLRHWTEKAHFRRRESKAETEREEEEQNRTYCHADPRREEHHCTWTASWATACIRSGGWRLVRPMRLLQLWLQGLLCPRRVPSTGMLRGKGRWLTSWLIYVCMQSGVCVVCFASLLAGFFSLADVECEESETLENEWGMYAAEEPNWVFKSKCELRWTMEGSKEKGMYKK